ncbi:hypothetical protein [Saccharopolyspora rosea]|uniref:GGDEF domain-containing protein n=1 Tax=Saccharopolyspora rosea TaxID=524884 RepID=A0ABW3FZ84_9PSEU|nr:hypothetical protein [Saccharopolyspora rosea]
MRDWPLRCDVTTGGRGRALRSRWRTASLAAGWPFPSDWDSPAVDAVCSAVTAGADVGSHLAELGAARAEAGVGLAGTLQDLAALHAVSTGEHDGLVSADPDAVPASMLRTTALGWAEVLSRQAVDREVEDPLTGLTTAGYLRTRLHELYREAGAVGRDPDAEHALVLVSLRIPDDGYGYPRMLAMVLAADVLRSVFAAGETTSLVRPTTAAVLARRGPGLTDRCRRAQRLILGRLADDPSLPVSGAVDVHERRLPADHDGACVLLANLQ